MNYLVLGGTRFVGLSLVQLLHSQGHAITLLNRGQTQTPLPEGVNRIRADRSESDQISAALKGRQFDAAFDISGYKPSELRPVIDVLNGNVGSYVFCSSAAVYPTTDIAPILEDHPLNRSPEAGEYTRDKVLCEDMLMEAFRSRGFPATTMRPPYVYGPHDHLQQRQLSIFARLTWGRAVIVPGNGLALTHSVHVDDLAAAFASVPGRAQAPGQAYNVAGPDSITANGYIGTIASVMGVETEIVHVDARDYEAMLGELTQIETAEIFDYHWRESLVYSNEKLRHQLGWSPRYDTRSGVEMTYRWWLRQGLDKEAWDFSSDDQALAWLQRNSADEERSGDRRR